MLKKALEVILQIQELDMQMLRLMRLKNERQSELKHIDDLRQDLMAQLSSKESEVKQLTQSIMSQENKILDAKEHIKKLEAKQSSLRKVEEYKALTQEMSSAEKERTLAEQTASDLIDKRTAEEEIFAKIKESLQSSEESSKSLEAEIRSNIHLMNAEGRTLKAQRDALAAHANGDILRIYEKLLNNKKDRVIVPMENRTCSGCHISLTAQHENLVRKGEKLVFCEHCSRVLFWQEGEIPEGEAPTKRRRRRTA